MAHLDDLLEEISDSKLRGELKTALAELRQHRKFGLFFERHSPETVTLPDVPPAVGEFVRLRAELGGRLYHVDAIDGASIQLTSLDEDREPRIAQLAEIATVKRFGEPVYPGLVSLERLVHGDPSRPYHAVINGENFHVLQLLTYLHEGSVDCIYIDPPYNTGSRDWKYNNRYVDDSDAWRHSKWLSFMEKRLRLARRLLRPDTGVLIVTIDEHEVHHLGMLLEQMFPNHLSHMVTVVHNPKGTYKANFARVDEYAFFVVPKSEEDGGLICSAPLGLFQQASSPDSLASSNEWEEELLYLRRRGQESSFRHQRPNQFYAILVNERTKKVVGVGPPLSANDPAPVSKDGDVITVYPYDTRGEQRVWRYMRETMQQYVDAGDIVVTGYSKRTPKQGWILQHRVRRRAVRRLKTVWWEKRHDAGMHGSDLLTAQLGETGRFPFPKSVYAVRDCLAAVVANKPDALILDFFAGSGTTFHATCLLNAADGGSRRCILVTNNEVDERTAKSLVDGGAAPGDPTFEAEGIFERVTVPRVRATVTGRRADGTPVPGEHVWADRRPHAEGFPENVEFFRLAYHDPDSIDLGRQFDAVMPALWLRAGAQGGRESMTPEAKWSIPEGGRYAILADDSVFLEFRRQLLVHKHIRHVYFITDSEDAYAEMVSALPPDYRTSMLYRDYLRNFEINTWGVLR